MVDSAAYVKEAMVAGSKIKLMDNGDGTYSIATYSAGSWHATGDLYQNFNSAGTRTIKSGPGTLVSLAINKPTISSSITIYDNTSASGTKIATLSNPLTLLQQQVFIPYNVNFTTGLTIVTSSNDDVTVIYR